MGTDFWPPLYETMHLNYAFKLICILIILNKSVCKMEIMFKIMLQSYLFFTDVQAGGGVQTLRC